jgi:regulator of replication initiation timing
MTERLPLEKLVLSTLETIDPSTIADEPVRQTMQILLNRIEQLEAELKTVKEENQQLRDENNRLKGEQGKPDIKAKNKKGFASNHDSEKERKTPKKHDKSSKNSSIIIDRTEILHYPQEKLPPDAQFKGYDEVVVREIKLETNNVLFRKEKYYSPTLGKTYLAELPPGYDGEFGPEIKALVISLYYGSNVTQGKLLEFLGDIGIYMSAGYLSNLLIRDKKRLLSKIGTLSLLPLDFQISKDSI